eukprot:gnl/MRDRNA2_/MRDRNA2_122915_c0_seq1.p1 gnl/MRDRNA2_/MRDRNA2_122915_c0~~gnl/MRDRNA2_/MRDRNA2_122915_c0_seq1.p1  ORF type:complete len:814 (+),score=139.43 gnl/MRDRNA2_/MRDRNA2_122915_c0_seq1:94-2535(+)
MPVIPPQIGAAVCGGLASFAVPEIVKRVRYVCNKLCEIRRKVEEDVETWGGGAAMPRDEAARMRKLKELGVLDTNDNEERFDDITRIVSAILGVPIVLISLVAEDRQWFKSRTGLGATSTGRDPSFCAWTFIPKAPRMLIVPDAKTDSRFAKNPLVTGDPFIRFYAGCPLVTAEGYRLGAFCIIDRVPRVITTSQQQIVINFAELISRQLEKERLDQSPYEEDLHDFGKVLTSQDFEGGALRADRVRESLSEPVLLVSMSCDDSYWPILYANEEWYKLTKFPKNNDKGYMSYFPGSNTHFLQCLEPLNVAGSGSLNELFGSFIGDGFCFGLSCETRTAEKIKFTCRCQPADKPLDANAEAIQIVRDPESGAVVGPEDHSHNRLYFVIMTRLKSPPKSSRSHEDNRSLSSAVSSSDKSVHPQSPPSHWNSSNADTEILEQPSTMAGKTLQSLESIRAPSTPFSDVRLIKIIGKGSFAKVFYGLWIGQPVAVKVASWTKTCSGEARPIFEAALSQELSHPNLVQTFKHSSVLTGRKGEVVVQTDGVMSMRNSEGVSPAQALSAEVGDHFETWITQEWCDMGSLRAHVERTPPMKRHGWSEVVGICVDISSAVTYMHGRGIIHGDLTANNVLLTCKPSCTKGYICKVSDFGLSRILEGDNESILTQQIGTVTFMPPELFTTQGSKLTRAADVYAMGIMMWHVFTGEVPYKSLTPPQVIVQVAQGQGLELPASAAPIYATLYKQCIDRSPESRPSMEVVNGRLIDFSMSMTQSQTPKLKTNSDSSEDGRKRLKVKKVASSKARQARSPQNQTPPPAA